MVCNCTDCTDENVIKIVRGCSCSVTFIFNCDISTYSSAEFVIRKNYDKAPVIEKTLTGFSENSVDLNLTPDETALLNEFDNGKSSSRYIWGLDFIDSLHEIRVNAFPQTGQAAPLCIVYKHVAGE